MKIQYATDNCELVTQFVDALTTAQAEEGWRETAGGACSARLTRLEQQRRRFDALLALPQPKGAWETTKAVNP